MYRHCVPFTLGPVGRQKQKMLEANKSQACNQPARHRVYNCNEEKEEYPTPKDTAEDTFSFNQNRSDQTNSPSSTTGMLTSFCKSISENIKKMFNVLNPFIKLLEEESKGEETTVEEVQSVFKDICKTLTKGDIKVSKETEEAIKELSEISDSGGLKGKNLNELIEKWKTEKEVKCLLEIAQRIEKGECIALKEEKLKEMLIKGLTSLHDAIAEAESKGEGGKETKEKLNEAAKPLVGAVEIANKDGKKDLSLDDKKEIGKKLEESKQHVQEVLEDPDLSKCLSCSTISSLKNLYTEIVEFLLNFWEELKKEEEKRRKEEECEERKKKLDEARVLHRKHEVAETKKACLKRIAERFKSEMMLALKLARDERFKTKAKYLHETMKAETEKKNFLNAEKYSRDEQAKENFYRYLEDSVLDSMPPPSACSEINFLNLFLDDHC